MNHNISSKPSINNFAIFSIHSIFFSVYHWDFRQYKVCKKAKIFMRAMAHEPIIEASRLAPETKEFSKELRESLELRKELVFMNAYLATCLSKVKPNAKKQFDKLLAPRNYLVTDDLEPG